MTADVKLPSLARPDMQMLLGLNETNAAAGLSTAPTWTAVGTRPEPCSGWRVWGVHPNDALLRSPYTQVPWPDTAVSAPCSRHGVHRTPQPECREGIFMFADESSAFTAAAVWRALGSLLNEAAGQLCSWTTYVVGQLSTAGIVNEHFNPDLPINGCTELIAQQVSFERLFVAPELSATGAEPLAAALRERYVGLPVHVLSGNREIDGLIKRIQTGMRCEMRLLRARGSSE